MRVLDYGDRALLVELPGTREAVAYAVALAARLAADPAAAALVEQVVPAARTVLVVGRAGAGPLRVLVDDVAASGHGPDSQTPETGERELVEVPVVYDGDDLDDVASSTGLSRAEVVEAHTAQTWQVAFGGFAPGFGYLVGENDRLRVPRRAESRTTVPRGSVALAGEYSGVYPTSSPGGWQLIGRTGVTLWDVDRDPPALLRPGVRVRFVAVDDPGADR